MGQSTKVIFFAACCLVIWVLGCAGLVESTRGILGVSTKVLEDGRKNAIKKLYPADYAMCKKTVDGVLADNKAYVYSSNESKKMVAFYLSDSDTTPVGVFFIVKGDALTEVSVSSPSRYAKELIADKISARVDKVLPLLQAQADAGSTAIPADQKEKEAVK